MQTTPHPARPARAYPADEPTPVTAARLAAQLRAAAQLLDDDPSLSSETVEAVRVQHASVGRVLFVLWMTRRTQATSCFCGAREGRA